MSPVESFERAFVAASLVLKGGRGAHDLLEPGVAARTLDAELREGTSTERAGRLGRALLPLTERLEARRLR